MNCFIRIITAALVMGACVALLVPRALADGVSRAAAIDNMWKQDYQKIQACQTMKIKENDSNFTQMVGHVTNMNTAVHCWSISAQLMACYNLALQAGSALEIERSGQSTFAELEDKALNHSGDDGHFAQGLSLVEHAPKNMSPDQLTFTVYKQCSSYAAIH